ncbi:MAG: sigma-70 family RNA polymerase sigma factor [Actinomycetota bacterium]
MYEPDPETIRSAASGDADAFEELVRNYQAHVWRFLRHLVGDPQLAEDVAQEAFLRVYQKLDTFRFRSKFSTWVFQTAHNAGVDAIRARTRRERLLRSAPLPAQSSDPYARVEVRAALASLSPKLRGAVVLVEVFGFGYREAAAILDVPEGTVKSRVFQARERLSEWLADEERVHEV